MDNLTLNPMNGLEIRNRDNATCVSQKFFEDAYQLASARAAAPVDDQNRTNKTLSEINSEVNQLSDASGSRNPNVLLNGNGTKRFESYKDGTQDVQVLFDLNGRKQYELRQENGKDVSTKFFDCDTGHMFLSGRYDKNGKISGKIYYDRNTGKKSLSVAFRDEKPFLEQIWDKNGKLHDEIVLYPNGARSRVVYKENGEIFFKATKHVDGKIEFSERPFAWRIGIGQPDDDWLFRPFISEK